MPNGIGRLGAVADHLDDDALAFAHRMFDLARAGDADELAAYVAEGLPPDLTNDKGDTLLILAAYLLAIRFWMPCGETWPS